jgi:uncharacterized protein
MSPRQFRIWTLTTGENGMASQAIGLAEAIMATAPERWQIEAKIVTPRLPWRWLPSALAPRRLASVTLDTGEFTGPLPDLIIACGRRSIPAALALRAQGVFTVYVQSPDVPADRFDLVVPPRHDRFPGANVLPTRGSLHRVTAEKLAAAAEEWRPHFAHLPRPWTAVLVGGRSKAYSFGQDDALRLTDQLQQLEASGHSLLLTTSRRTGPHNTAILRKSLPDAFVWSSPADGPNPYFGLLALADHIIATCDSANMVSEAVFTGKPVHIVELSGGKPRFRRFLDGMYADGFARRFEGLPLSTWTYTPPDDRRQVARAIIHHLTNPK